MHCGARIEGVRRAAGLLRMHTGEGSFARFRQNDSRPDQRKLALILSIAVEPGQSSFSPSWFSGADTVLR